jgi:hypothetical protein
MTSLLPSSIAHSCASSCPASSAASPGTTAPSAGDALPPPRPRRESEAGSGTPCLARLRHARIQPITPRGPGGPLGSGGGAGLRPGAGSGVRPGVWPETDTRTDTPVGLTVLVSRQATGRTGALTNPQKGFPHGKHSGTTTMPDRAAPDLTGPSRPLPRPIHNHQQHRQQHGQRRHDRHGHGRRRREDRQHRRGGGDR